MSKKARPRAVVTTPDGKEHEVYFICASCGRSFIWSLDGNGCCPKCGHNTFKIVGLGDDKYVELADPHG